MFEASYATTLYRGWKSILAFALASAIFATSIGFLFPLEYSSGMRLLIIQERLSQTDPYTAIRASERIADNLGQIIYTTSFFDKVMESRFNIDRTVFEGLSERRKREIWSNMIATQVIRNSGMLAVTVYHEDPDQAEQISRAIAFVLTTEGWQYIGGGDLTIRLVDEPLVSTWPVKPNIPGNALMGFMLGIFAGVGYVFVREARKQRVSWN